ncbi:MAG TPA: CAP domain-containing protein, partial [Allosphingosinicella sp.]|nr:CAP domain-containing protein [Allosphingosinicella sp.]
APILPMAFAAMAAAQPPTIVEPWKPGPAPERSDMALRAAMLQSHNEARRAVGVGPLVWDAALARDAAAYAREMARTGRFAHAPHVPGAVPQGENLFMGTRGAYSFAEMVQGWVDERRLFRRGRFPDVSRTGRYGDVAHYTQIVWPRTLRVGCALASNRRTDYLACRYSPPGNVVGEDPLAR